MSSSRSKSKDKRTPGKEPPKPSTKPTATAPASGYNPLLGTFHSLDTAPVSSVQPVHVNGRFRDIDDTYDPIDECVSNNGSWSGESEDPKDKPSHGPSFRQEAGPGVVTDSDKREKIRQKNEKKHQRQKERRAQELHDRCCGYLMSRKLEALAQQLVAMGFSSESATMALIANEGKLEESVAWLFEGGEESVNQKDRKSDLKVDISQELSQIADMEVKFKCSKQDVERAVVACEGDLEQAAENLSKLQKHESNAASVPPKPPSIVAPVPPASQLQQSKQNFPTMAVAAGRSVAEPGGRNLQLLKKVPPAPSLEKRRAATPVSKTEIQYASVGNELRNLQIGSMREPVIMMQRTQSKHIPTPSMSSSSSSVSYSTNIEPLTGLNPNGFHATRSFKGDQTHGPFHHHGGQPPVATTRSNNNGLWSNMGGGSPPLTAATSLGLFSGFGSNGLSHVDWNSDWSSQSDYTNIDWSVNRAPVAAGSPFVRNGLRTGSGSSLNRIAGGPMSSIGGLGVGLSRPDGIGVVEGSERREWTSPFEEKDLFSLPRQFVSSPSL